MNYVDTENIREKLFRITKHRRDTTVGDVSSEIEYGFFYLGRVSLQSDEADI